MTRIPIPPLHPRRFLRGGHRQTLWAFFAPGPLRPYAAGLHSLVLPDGDHLMIHDDCPNDWRPGDPFVLLLHGLSGSHASVYMARIGARLFDCGVRVFRLDHRGCGAGARRARHPYHAGRSDDVRAAFHFVSGLCNGSLGAIAGFSLSGNMLLKMLGEESDPQRFPRYLACAAAVNPPIDLQACSNALQRRDNRIYDRHFTRLLCRDVQTRLSAFADAPRPVSARQPRCLREFDDLYTAPVSGFADVEDYYVRCSAAQFIPKIQLPTLILTAADDPLIPVEPFRRLPPVPSVQLHISEHGGHLGYLAQTGSDPDCYWMDWRLLEWLAAHLRFRFSRLASR